MRNDALLDVVGIDQIFPGLEIEMEDGLLFLNALVFDLFRLTGGGSIWFNELDDEK